MSGLSSPYHSLSSDLSSGVQATRTTTPVGDTPRLKPNQMWTLHFGFDTLPGFSLGPTSAWGQIYFPSYTYLMALPAPVLPSVSQDGIMRQYERSLVDRLDQRMRQSRAMIEVPPVGSRRTLGPLSPVYAKPEAQRMLSSLAIPNMSKIFMRQLSQQEQLSLRAWGQTYLGDSQSADVLIHAVSLHRPSDMSEIPNPAGSSPLISTKHMVLRARIRRRNNRRENFFIRRVSVIDNMRASIPDPPYTGYELLSPATVGRSPEQIVQRSTLLSQPLRRSSSCAQNACSSPRQGIKSNSISDYHTIMYGSRTMPIHIDYARLYTPLLAALIVSGHVKKGDLIDLPLPHPEAWQATVAYIYTGRDEPTTTVKENIAYLTGKGPIS